MASLLLGKAYSLQGRADQNVWKKIIEMTAGRDSLVMDAKLHAPGNGFDVIPSASWLNFHMTP